MTGRPTDCTTRRMSSAVLSPGAYSTSAPAVSERLEPRDRVVEIRVAVEVVLRARGQDQMHGPAVGDLDRRRDPLRGELERVDRIVCDRR